MFSMKQLIIAFGFLSAMAQASPLILRPNPALSEALAVRPGLVDGDNIPHLSGAEGDRIAVESGHVLNKVSEHPTDPVRVTEESLGTGMRVTEQALEFGAKVAKNPTNVIPGKN
ncbi:hypothetical protein H072_10993 [Dactylellina haptotyla CBS 200.50]|uniref:Uncharacterized protein n=1 Tax=Dactylellina haptotyla (strain CBS 200.50) TaxID=1284197 RepID=S8A362_DACHA|nr:hypothetical protein H072_10993 [Dactylellina haptotyla CBS 200.50]